MTVVIMTGTGDKKIVVWDLMQIGRDKSVVPCQRIDARTFGQMYVVNMNPRNALLATAATELVTLDNVCLRVDILAARYVVVSRCVDIHILYCHGYFV